MDRLEAMRLFTRVVDRRSFTQAAHDLDIPRSTVTQAIQQIEKRLGVRLLQRTTRIVRPTLDGEAYYRRCLAILDDIEDAEGAFSGAVPKGTLRVEVQGTLARHFLMPGLPGFLAKYPEIQIAMSESDRWVDVVREGVDCVLRYGALRDSDLVARVVTTLERVTCAAPAYLKRHGRPNHPRKLLDHACLRGRFEGRAMPTWEFERSGTVVKVNPTGPLIVSIAAATDLIVEAAVAGSGIIYLFEDWLRPHLDSGSLKPVLEPWWQHFSGPFLYYPSRRRLPTPLRAFVDFIGSQRSSR